MFAISLQNIDAIVGNIETPIKKTEAFGTITISCDASCITCYSCHC